MQRSPTFEAEFVSGFVWTAAIWGSIASRSASSWTFSFKRSNDTSTAPVDVVVGDDFLVLLLLLHLSVSVQGKREAI